MTIREILEEKNLFEGRFTKAVQNKLIDDLEQELSVLMEKEKGEAYKLGYNDAQREYQVSEEQVKKIIESKVRETSYASRHPEDGGIDLRTVRELLTSPELLAKAICSLPVKKMERLSIEDINLLQDCYMQVARATYSKPERSKGLVLYKKLESMKAQLEKDRRQV